MHLNMRTEYLRDIKYKSVNETGILIITRKYAKLRAFGYLGSFYGRIKKDGAPD